MAPAHWLDRRDFVKFASAAAALFGARGLFAQPSARADDAPPNAGDPVYHFMNRICYGVNAAELAEAQQIGIEAYLDQQLNPETIKDSTGDKAARKFRVLEATREKLLKTRDGEKFRRALLTAMIVRAASSKRQLLERMVEFWSDHFNITSDGLETDVALFQTTVIRKFALGNFKDLLTATAKSPAMLYYLSNFENVAEHPNENYARELMELHTLGVDGGYTETDVKEVARAFTGWSVNDEEPDGFRFRDKRHDKDSKQVLGNLLAGGRGLEDGEQVIDILLKHPSTPRYICRKLCIRFVSDSPPQSLIDNLATVWTQNSGDIKSVLRALFLSPEFAASTGQKFRRPLDFFIGAIRTTGTEFTNFYQFEYLLAKLSQSPYGWPQPNGYPEPALAWANSNGLVARWNTAQFVTESAINGGRNSGLKTQLLKRIGKPASVNDLVDNVAKLVFGTPLTGSRRDLFVQFVAGKDRDGSSLVDKDTIKDKVGTLCGLMLASPYYQWR